MYPDQGPKGIGTLVLPTSVLLIRGGPHPAAGRRLVDYLVSPGAEAELCRSRAYFPLRTGVAATDGARRLADIRATPLDVARTSEALERIRPSIERWLGR